MGQKSYSALIVGGEPGFHEHLQRTHRMFNDAVRGLMENILRWARQKDDVGAMARGITDLNAQFAVQVLKNFMNPESKKTNASTNYASNLIASASKKIERIDNRKSKSKKGQAARDARRERNIESERLKRGQELLDAIRRLGTGAKKPLQDYFEAKLAVLPNAMAEKAVEEAIQALSSHRELMEIWRKDHEQWKIDKPEWEKENAAYMKIRPLFQKFREESGKTGRGGRWEKYQAFLTSNGDVLAKWRDPNNVFVPLTPDEEIQIKRARKRDKEWRKLFWAKNPEIREVDRLDYKYEREFARTNRPRNNDGYARPPTLTLPRADKHPRWLRLKGSKPEGYKNLQLPEAAGAKGTLDMLVITSDAPGPPRRRGGGGYKKSREYPNRFVSIVFKCDPRLARVRELNPPVKTPNGKKEDTWYYQVQAPGEPADRRLCNIGGARLIMKDGRYHLQFAVDFQDRPADPAAVEVHSTPETKRLELVNRLPNGIVTCAVDLGQRRPAFVTCVRHQAGHSKIIKAVPIRRDVLAIRKHKRDLAAAHKKLGGAAPKGERSFKGLRDHIDNTLDYRSKAVAAQIIDVARNAGASIIIIEKLKGLRPSEGATRGLNRAMADWGRAQVRQHLEHQCKHLGIALQEILAAYTSKVCNKCRKTGGRFRLVKGGKEESSKTGAWFRCSACGYRADADFNASLNMHRVYLEGWGEFTRLAGIKAKKKSAEPLDGKDANGDA